jgi:alkylation response protein AidB-like acyl-CoA dehydrogenase
MMNAVVNTARVMLPLACAAMVRRAYLEAATFARHRRAFGDLIIHYPLVQVLYLD